MLEEPNSEINAEPVKLTDITRGLYHAASSTYSMVANQYIQLLSQYFDKTLDGTYIPKTVVVQLPDETLVDLPLISLVAPKGLMLDKVNFDFAVVADPTMLREATTELDGLNLTRSSFAVEMAAQATEGSKDDTRRKEGIVDISMKFKAIDPPEGLMRLLDKFASIVTPLKPETGANNYMPLLSPRLFSISKTLSDDAELREKFERFNAVEFTPDAIAQKGEELKQWEGQLLAISVEIDELKAKALPTFKNIVEYARIAYKGTEDYEKLKLSQKVSTRSREWVHQATQFYKTLLEDKGLAFKLARLQHVAADAIPLSKLWTENHDLVKKVAQKLEAYDAHKLDKTQYEEAKEWLQKFNAIAKIQLKDDPALLAKLFPDTEFLNK